MPTIKRHKIWYILEGIRMWGGYKGDSENDHVYLPTPEWKDINGNTYTHIYAGLYEGPTDFHHNNIIYKYYQYTQATGADKRQYLQFPYVWRGLLSNYSSFDSFIKVYATADTLNQWSENDYTINPIGTVELETNFAVVSDPDSPQPDIMSGASGSEYTKHYTIRGGSDSELINYGQRGYEVSIRNQTQSNITVSCLKFTKNIANVDISSPYADEITPDDSYDDIITQNGTIFEAETLYVSYYLDEPLIIEPEDEKILNINFTPDMNKKNNFQKTRYWAAAESCRLAIVPEAKDIATMQYHFSCPYVSGYPDLKLTNSKIFWPTYMQKDQYPYAHRYLLGLWIPFYDIDNLLHPCVFGGTYPDKTIMEGKIRLKKPTGSEYADEEITIENRYWDHLNYWEFWNSFKDSNDELHASDQLSFQTMASFTKDTYAYASTELEQDWTIYSHLLELDLTSESESSFHFTNNKYYRKYKVKAINDSLELKTWTCIKFTKKVPYMFDDQTAAGEFWGTMVDILVSSGSNIRWVNGFKETLYGAYFFDTPIPIPPGEFRTVTLTVTPEDISIDVIIDDDEEEEEGEG